MDVASRAPEPAPSEVRARAALTRAALTRAPGVTAAVADLEAAALMEVVGLLEVKLTLGLPTGAQCWGGLVAAMWPRAEWTQAEWLEALG